MAETQSFSINIVKFSQIDKYQFTYGYSYFLCVLNLQLFINFSATYSYLDYTWCIKLMNQETPFLLFGQGPQFVRNQIQPFDPLLFVGIIFKKKLDFVKFAVNKPVRADGSV